MDDREIVDPRASRMAISSRWFSYSCVVHGLTWDRAGCKQQKRDIDFGNLVAQKGNNQILPRKETG